MLTPVAQRLVAFRAITLPAETFSKLVSLFDSSAAPVSPDTFTDTNKMLFVIMFLVIYLHSHIRHLASLLVQAALITAAELPISINGNENENDATAVTPAPSAQRSFYSNLSAGETTGIVLGTTLSGITLCLLAGCALAKFRHRPSKNEGMEGLGLGICTDRSESDDSMEAKS